MHLAAPENRSSQSPLSMLQRVALAINGKAEVLRSSDPPSAPLVVG
jgi:hypothetical protein